MGSRKQMKRVVKPAISKKQREICVAQELRKWQKNSKSKRCSLSVVAARCGSSVAVLRRVLEGKGPRHLGRKAKADVVFLSARSCAAGTSASSVRAVGAKELSVRRGQRLAKPILQAERAQKRRALAKRRREATPITDEQLSQLVRFSQRW